GVLGFSGRLEKDVSGEPRQVREEQRRGVEIVRGEVAVGDGVDGVARRAGESEGLRQTLAIDLERSAGDRAGAERACIAALERVREPREITRQHLDVRAAPERER